MAKSKHTTTGNPAASNAVQPLPTANLCWRCEPANIPFESTAEVEPIPGVVGQDDAVDALRFGLATGAPGQNVFVRGLSGTGRMTLLKGLLEEIRPACPFARDRCYVHNFTQPDRPRLITLPRGKGGEFRRQVNKLAGFICDDLAAAISSERIKERRAALDRTAEKQLEDIMKPFNEALQAAGLALVTFQAGPVMRTAIFPLVEGKPVQPEEFEQLHADGQVNEEQYEAVRASREQFEGQLAEVSEKVNEIRQRHDRDTQELLEKDARWLLSDLTRDIKRDFPEPGVYAFLDEIVEDVIKNRLGSLDKEDDIRPLYRVNVLLERKDEDACPIILENNPTMHSLLGMVDYEFAPGQEPRASHMGIRAGSLLRADGGYLVLDVRDVLSEPGAWKVLVRALRTGRLEIVPPELVLPWSMISLKPEPIDVHVKVVLLGDATIYYLLDAADPDFPQLFKVLADFDTTIPRDEQGVGAYVGVLARIARDEQLPPFDRTAMVALVEHGARIAARRDKLTTRFGRLADIAREAAFIAGKRLDPNVAAGAPAGLDVAVGPRTGRSPVAAGAPAGRVTGDDVREAIQRTKRRADLPARQFRQLVAEGIVRIQTQGSTIGQVNGLAVLQAGPLTYGFPARITATIGPGTAGVINIEREAALSGAIHTKGFYILGGLLRWLLRTDHPLAFNASVAFEQSYGGIDGDSASAAEICSLLSALTDVPLRQDLAITSAIDQMGHILPIGGVNEKIEGFYDACRDTGLIGTQGVIIPRANAGDLMLREDVVQDCDGGRFQVYAVDTIQEALELLTGMPAGVRDAAGRYPDNTLLGRAVKQAHEYWTKVAQHRH